MDQAAHRGTSGPESTVQAKDEAELKKLEDEFVALQTKEAELKQDLASEQSEIDAIEGNVRAIAKEAVSQSRDNPITARLRTEPLRWRLLLPCVSFRVCRPSSS